MKDEAEIELPSKIWAAIGSKSGTVFQVMLSPVKPLMLPPCSNQDLPKWVELVPKMSVPEKDDSNDET